MSGRSDTVRRGDPVEDPDPARPDGRKKRFGELQRSIGGISQKVLTQQLRAMEEDGLMERTVHPVIPPHVEYSLTETGRSLKPILDAMWAWGEDYREKHPEKI